MVDIAKRFLTDSKILILLSVVDLTLGILSMCFSKVEWQISSLIASCLTFTMIVKILLCREATPKTQIFTLILSLLDITSGALSVALVIYVFKALTVACSALKTSKIAIQASKATQLIKGYKPLQSVVKSICIKAFPLISAYIIDKKTKNKEVNNMAKNEVNIVEAEIVEKKNVFKTIGNFIKNNYQTIIGFLAFIYVCLEAKFGWIGGGLGGVGISADWCYLIMTPLYGLIVNALCKSGIEIGNSKAVRLLAKTVGLETVYNELSKQYEDITAKEKEQAEIKAQLEAEEKAKADEQAKIKAELEAEAKANAEQAEKIKAEIEAAKIKSKVEQTKIDYQNAIANGTFTGTLIDWLNK